ncbi:polymerase, nucleotidyl transferase domain containing protein [Parasponia andersonii]|uniref:Polymerase, nucleotidyl transferase domain containing protein n=1 Tax=Parasponia andersonii TaxID=3476 RepID=A0A2P5ALE6_PARAD|nr:polymerase, nucleotidyl transferase domain containing protein [Parasponia andersonii]
MSANGVLEHTLRDILDVVKPANDDWVTRFQIIDEFREIVGSLESLRGATVEPFGSFVSNLFSRWGDLDISIQLANGSFISSSGKKLRQKLLGELIRAMRQRGKWERLQLIPNARVPILKVESNLQNITCDISIDNLQGHMKSKLLLWMNEIDTRFRDMVLLVKEWAKARNINNPKSGTFNSYSLCLLVIFHFQRCRPAIFPPLKDIYPGNISDDLQGLRANAERLITETCAANIARFKSDKLRAVNRSSLSELFISFLAKFSDISRRASESGISTYTGQWEYISSNTRWLPQTYALFIEDPFERPENSARAVNKNQLTRITEAFQSTCNRLTSANLNQSSLIGSLVQQQTFQLITRNPRNHAGAYQPTRPQWQTTEHLHSPNTSRGGGRHQPMRPQGVQRPLHPSQVQSQYQGSRSQVHYKNSTTTGPRVQTYSQPQTHYQGTRPPGHYSNSTATGPYVQTYQNQGQQVWRPKSGR